MKWESDARMGDTTFKSWVTTEFVPGQGIDGYAVRLARYVRKGKTLDFDAHYWNFDGQWVAYTEGDALGPHVPRGAFLDPHLDLLRGIEEPLARQALGEAIKQAREYERSPKS